MALLFLYTPTGGWASAVRENQVLRVGMDSMRMRVSELEKECSNMKQEIEKLGRGKSGGWKAVPKKLHLLRIKSQMCSAQEPALSASEQQQKSVSEKLEKLQAKITKHKKQLSADL